MLSSSLRYTWLRALLLLLLLPSFSPLAITAALVECETDSTCQVLTADRGSSGGTNEKGLDSTTDLHQHRDDRPGPSSPRLPGLKWHLRGISEEETTPFVVIEDVLPTELLTAVLREIEDYSVSETDAEVCTLRRDDLDCGEERWLDFSLRDAQQQDGATKARDIFEQAVLHTARLDMLRVLPASIATHVKGVSWRILVVESGDNEEVFHYDSDEDMDHALEEVPMIFPLLSTVTYLNNHGEPTVIFEQTMLSAASAKRLDGNTTNSFLQEQNLVPAAAYVSMPNTNKHVAFDSRLFHGSSAPISKHVGELRICIGTNFHTHRSLESTSAKKLADLDQDKIIPPLVLSANAATIAHDVVAKVRPWNPDNLLPVPQRDGGSNDVFQQKYPQPWETFRLNTRGYGVDYCQQFAPCSISVRLPIEKLLSDEIIAQMTGAGEGATVGFALTPQDFVITPITHDEPKREVQSLLRGDLRGEARTLASEMLQRRCEIFDHDLFVMNPPLNYDLCDGVGSSEEKTSSD